MIINIKVIPNAKKQNIKIESKGLKIHLKSKAQKGEANEELINLLASYFNIPKSSISIVKGAYSRDKLIEIS